MHLEILTPEKSIFAGEVDAVSLPGLEGELQILKNHAPIIAVLQSGKVKLHGIKNFSIQEVEVFDKEDQIQTFSIRSGIVEVKNNKIAILSD